jgi:hypothetical protein
MVLPPTKPASFVRYDTPGRRSGSHRQPRVPVPIRVESDRSGMVAAEIFPSDLYNLL